MSEDYVSMIYIHNYSSGHLYLLTCTTAIPRLGSRPTGAFCFSPAGLRSQYSTTLEAHRGRLYNGSSPTADCCF